MSISRTISLVLILALIGAFLSGLLLLQHYNQAHENALVKMMCGGDNTGGCEAVDKSDYSSLFGIPLSVYGGFFYLSIALFMGLALAGDSKSKEHVASLVFAIASIGFLVDLALLAIQAFVLAAFCNLCLSTYAVTLVILLLLWKHKSFSPSHKIKALKEKSEGKMLLASGIIGSIVIGVAVLALNFALSYRDPETLDARMTELAYEEYLENEVAQFDTAGIPFMGSPGAPIKIMLYSDFLCPWCKQVAQNFKQNFQLWGDRVVVYYRSFPLDKFCNPNIGQTLHPGSCWTALGGVCAQDQGKFWEYHDRMFEVPPRMPNGKNVLDIAWEVGIDTAKMKQCMMSIQNQGRVRSLIKEAGTHEILSTPVMFINGRRLPRLGDLAPVLKREAARLGIPPLEGLND